MAKSVLNIPYSRRQESHQSENVNEDEVEEPINVALFDYRPPADGGITTDFTTTVLNHCRGVGDGVPAEDSDFDSCDELGDGGSNGDDSGVALVSVKKLNADDLLPLPQVHQEKKESMRKVVETRT